MRRPIRSVLAGAVAAALTVGVVACAPPAEEEDVDRTITIAVEELSSRFDPTQGEVSLGRTFHWQAVLTPLFHWGPDGSAIPQLATDYVVGDDHQSVDVTLREDVTFPDGTHMDAAGVAEFLEYAIHAEGFGFRVVVEQLGMKVEASGEYTIRITTTAPFFHPESMYYDPIRIVLGTAVLSPAAIDDPERAQVESMGVGPYLVDEVIADSEVTLVRNPDYWDPEAYPYDTIVLKLMTDPIARLNALKSGQVAAASLPIEQVGEAESSGLIVKSAAPSYTALIVRNPEGSTLEPLRDVRVRQAMMWAFDREAIAESLDLGFGVPTSQAFVEGQAEYVEGGDDRYGYDLDRARELMAEAGYADGFDVVIPTFDATYQPIIESALGEIGIRVTFENPPDIGAYFVALMGGEFPLTLMGISDIDTLRLLDEVFGGLGRVFDQDAEVDELLALIRFGDADESAEASQQLGEKLLDEAWYIPISRKPGNFWASTSDVDIAMDDSWPYLWDVRPAD